MELYRRRDIFVAPDEEVGAARIAVDGDIGEHTHDFIEIAFVLQGRARHRSVAGTVVLERGSVALVRPGSWHAYEPLEPLTVVNLYLAPELLHGDLSWILEHPALASALLRGGARIATISDAALERASVWLAQLELLEAPRRRPALLGLTSCILAELVDAELVGPPTATRPPSPFVRQAMTLLADDLDRPWTIAALAAATRVSAPHLHRSFRSQVGVAPLAWLDQLRGEAAARLLVQTDLPVAEIGRAVGWTDPNYASRRFRARYAMTPTQYRHQFTQPAGSGLR
ncbi:AraC family transcriptional regulator [Diaminobutyricibacter sp. McL0608]|uniref:AraC family transcriptional regulator n=1 Tax=Leifsonia sp. McL0608 TaxID=3143537 RepID=UPI0031F2F881